MSSSLGVIVFSNGKCASATLVQSIKYFVFRINEQAKTRDILGYDYFSYHNHVVHTHNPELVKDAININDKDPNVKKSPLNIVVVIPLRDPMTQLPSLHYNNRHRVDKNRENDRDRDIDRDRDRDRDIDIAAEIELFHQTIHKKIKRQINRISKINKVLKCNVNNCYNKLIQASNLNQPSKRIFVITLKYEEIGQWEHIISYELKKLGHVLKMPRLKTINLKLIDQNRSSDIFHQSYTKFKKYIEYNKDEKQLIKQYLQLFPNIYKTVDVSVISKNNDKGSAPSPWTPYDADKGSAPPPWTPYDADNDNENANTKAKAKANVNAKCSNVNCICNRNAPLVFKLDS